MSREQTFSKSGSKLSSNRYILTVFTENKAWNSENNLLPEATPEQDETLLSTDKVKR